MKETEGGKVEDNGRVLGERRRKRRRDKYETDDEKQRTEGRRIE